MRNLLPFIVVVLAGCSDRPTPVAFPVRHKPPVEVSPLAEQVIKQIAAEKKLEDPWSVRLAIVWKAEPEIEVHLDRTPPSPDDFESTYGDLKCVMARELLPYLRGCRIELVKVKGGSGFDVTFPNQDAQEREAARNWMGEQKAKRCAKKS